MKPINQFFYCLTIMSILLFSSCAKELKINTFESKKGIPGSIIEIHGENFNPLYYNNHVTVGNGDTKVISGTKNSLRVVLLRNISSGAIIVRDLDSGASDTSSVVFKREGTTTQATPLKDSDPELHQGLMNISNTKYDMNKTGTDQPILIILAQPSDISDPNSNIYYDTTLASNARDYIIHRASQANTFFKDASYNKTSANFVVTPNWIPLSQVRDFYMWQDEDKARAQSSLDGAEADLSALQLNPSTTTEEIEAAEALIETKKSALTLAEKKQGIIQEPDFFYAEALIGAKAAMPNFDDFGDYIVICAGPFLRGSCCWREEGFHAESSSLNLDFEIDFNAQKGLTYMAQGTHWGRLGHELSHFFAGGDLYPSGTTAGTAAPFAFMGYHDNGPLYIGYNMEKRLQYYHEDNIAKATWGSSATYNQTFDIVAHGTNEDDRTDNVQNLLSLKITEGMYYHVEVRQRPDGSPNSNHIFDKKIPLNSSDTWEGGVIVSSAIEESNQNNNQERQIQLLPPKRLLQVGDVVNDPARTIKISVIRKLADRPLKYRIQVEWGTLPAANPDGQFDLRITPWSPPPWESQDIWVNSTKNDETSPAKIIYKNHEQGDETKPIGNGDEPWVGKNNTLYARVRNNGAVPTPEEVKVSFYINTPPGVGDDGNWTPFDEVNLGILPANFDTIIQANRKWVPAIGEHTCIKVFIHKMTGEITFDNNQAQENFVEFESASGSPFKPVEFQVDVRNPYDYPVIMDMKARGVPRLWNVALEHGSIYLQPKEVRKMSVVIWSNIEPSSLNNGADHNNRKVNRKPLISIEGWVNNEAHSFFPVGGMTAFVQSVLKSEIAINAYYEDFKISGRGHVTPKNTNIPIAVHAIAPDGTRYSTRSITHTGGSFSFNIHSDKPFKPGEYKITGYILGGSILSKAESSPVLIEVK